MGIADVARLRFVLSADAGGLKAGAKEATGSLKDTENAFRGFRNRTDNGGIDWSGLKRSSRSLRFVGREMGGALKSGIGDAIGIATAGVGLGPLGAGLAIGAAGMSLIESHREQLEKQQTKAVANYRGSVSERIDLGSYSKISSIADGDQKFLEDMAGAMREIKEAGPDADDALKSLKRNIDELGSASGISGEGGADFKREQAALRAQKRFSDHGFNDWGGLYMAQRHSMEKDDVHGQNGFLAESLKTLIRGPEATLADSQLDYESDEKHVRAQASLRNDPSLKTNEEKLNDKLRHFRDLQTDINDDSGLSDKAKDEYSEKIGRGAKEAIDEYHKSQGGSIGMAGASVAGSAEAYGIVANAQMGAAGAENDAATTNAILERSFPELIKAVERIGNGWRTAGSPT